jgi:hypothetical protein
MVKLVFDPKNKSKLEEKELNLKFEKSQEVKKKVKEINFNPFNEFEDLDIVVNVV